MTCHQKLVLLRHLQAARRMYEVRLRQRYSTANEGLLRECEETIRWLEQLTPVDAA